MGMRIPPLRIKIMLEPNPLKPTMLVGRLGVFAAIYGGLAAAPIDLRTPAPPPHNQ